MKNILKEIREKKNLTQDKLSLKSGISRPTISEIETHKLKNIESNTMFSLAKALECDIGDIFFEETVVLKQREKR